MGMELFLQEIRYNYTLLPSDYTDLYYITTLFGFLKLYLTPVAVAVGIVGNTIGTLTIYRTRMRTLSCIAYLPALLTADSLYMLSVLFMWASLVAPALTKSDWWCLSTTYFTGLTTFLSLWFTLAMAVDRYLNLLLPGYFSTLTPLMSKLLPRVTVLGISTLGVVVHLNLTLMFGVVETAHGALCIPLHVFSAAVHVLGKLDLVFNFLVPYLALVAASVHAALLLRKSCSSGGGGARTTSHVTGYHSRRTRRDSESRAPRNLFVAEAEMTKVTLVAAAIFLFCNLPGHVVRTGAMIASLADPEFHMSFSFQRLVVWQQLLMFLFLLRPVALYPACLTGSRLLRRALRVAFTSNPDIRHPRRPSHLDLRNPITGNM